MRVKTDFYERGAQMVMITTPSGKLCFFKKVLTVLTVLIGLGLLTTVFAQTVPMTVPLPPFAERLPDWREVILDEKVAPNVFTARQWNGRQAVEVRSNNSMSLLATSVTVDLKETPFLCWWWQVDGALKNADMKSKMGDDFAARVYVSVKLAEDQMGLGRRLQLGLARAIWGEEVPDGAVNYVWDNLHAIGHEQTNAYTDLAHMVVLQTGDSLAGDWVAQTRNVGSDVVRLFGPGTQVVQVAVTTDTDNTGEQMRAGFADLKFVDHPDRCGSM